METTKIKLVLASAVALGCATLTYVILKRFSSRRAVNAFKHLKIEIVTNENHCDAVVQELRRNQVFSKEPPKGRIQAKVKPHYIALKTAHTNEATDDVDVDVIFQERSRRCAHHKAVGFDCEWVTENGKRQPVALVQLSSFDGYCGLFRLCHIGKVPQSLKELLEDEKIYKVGVAPAGDAKNLAQDYSAFLSSTLDIRHLVLLCGREPRGLGELARVELGIILDKSWRIRCSDWGANELSARQIQYAAADAHIAIKIFVNLINEYCDEGFLSRVYRRDSHWSGVDDICEQYADVLFKTKQQVKKGDLIKEQEKGKEWKEKLLSKRYANLTRSKPLYHNCFLQAPDGELLCTCDTKKAYWYIEKNLATLVTEDPLTVRLKFEPAGRSVGDVGKYYTLAKENKCVVCGSSNSYIRKNVVPREYRKYFPEIMKEHSCHDVVLLCSGCHQRSNLLDQAVRERLARTCRAPLSAHDSAKVFEDVDRKKVRSAARALLFQSKRHELPEERRKHLESIVLQHYPQHQEVTEELLQEAINVQVKYENEDYESHGHKVVQHYLEHDGLLSLERMWRAHFIGSMKPKHMPELWSLDHNEERLLMHYNEGRLTKEQLRAVGLEI